MKPLNIIAVILLFATQAFAQYTEVPAKPGEPGFLPYYPGTHVIEQDGQTLFAITDFTDLDFIDGVIEYDGITIDGGSLINYGFWANERAIVVQPGEECTITFPDGQNVVQFRVKSVDGKGGRYTATMQNGTSANRSIGTFADSVKIIRNLKTLTLKSTGPGKAVLRYPAYWAN